MAKKSGGGLNMVARLSVEEAIKNAQKLKKELKDIAQAAKSAGNTPANNNAAFSTKPLTEYQAGLLKIKQAALDLAKEKAEQAKADRAASIALQAALREESRLKREQIAAEKALQAEAAKRKPTQVSNSQAEIDAYNRAQKGSMLYTSAINAEIVAKARLNAESAKQAIANGTLNTGVSAATSVANENVAATNRVTLSKKQLAQMLAEEKLRQSDATRELKNNAREMLNAKGSLEQRRAALIRLTTVYDRLNKAERESTAGKRLEGIVKGLVNQISILEEATGRSGRKVGGYTDGIANFFSSIKNNILSTLGPIAILTAAWAALKAAFSHNVEISDNFVDVQRTAKLSAQEVDRLGDQLKKINTRTNLEGLLDIGFEGGRLSVAKADLVGFIETVDQLAVVLKKELPGGAEAVAESLGKIVKIYKLAENEGLSLADAMRKVGSLQLELAHSGGVTVKYLQDFTLGVAGTAVSAKLALPTIEAYGAVLSGAGTIASSAAISVTRLVTDLSVKRGKYFAIAQLADASLTVEKFNHLINTDTNAALLAFFKGLKAGNPVQTEFNDRIRSVGITTGKVMNAVKTLANNQELLAEKTVIGTKAYAEGTSVAHNFELANNSLAASFDKIKNSIVNAFTNSGITRSLAELLNMITDNRTESEKLTDKYNDNKHSIVELESSLKPLLTRYDELKKSGKLNTDEQTELRNIIVKIADLIPDAVSKMDAYGNALDINRKKVTDLTKAQRDLLELQNRDAVKQARKEFTDNITYLPIAKNRVESTKNATPDLIDRISNLGGGDIQKKRLQEAIDVVTEVSGKAYEAAKRIRDLGGTLSTEEKKIIAAYESINKAGKKKPKQEILGTGELADETEVARTTEVIKAEIKSLVDANKKLGTQTKLFQDNVKKILALKKELRLANGGKDTEGIAQENQYQTALKSRNDLQKQLDAVTKKGVNKQLTADAQEVESVKDKYKKMADAAAEFNNNPKNKAKGLRVDAGGLTTARDAEVAATIDKNETVKLKETLNDLKKQYDDYEQYKSKVGYEESDKRYAKLLENGSSYLDALAQKENAFTDANKNKGGVDTDPVAYAQRLKLIDDEKKEANLKLEKLNQEMYDVAYQAALTNAQALANVDREYYAKLKALGEGASDEQKDNLENERKEKKAYINAETTYRLSKQADLLNNIDSMTRVKAIEALDFAIDLYDKQYAAGKIQAKEYYDKIYELEGRKAQINKTDNNPFTKISESIKAYRKQLGGVDKDSIATEAAQAKMFDSMSEGAAAASTVIGDVAGSLSELGIGGEGLQNALKGVQGILEGAAGLAKGIATGNPVDIITGSIKLLTSAITLFNTKDAKLAKQIKSYQADLDSLGKAYKQLERDVQNAVGNDIYTDQAKQIENLKQQQLDLIKIRDAESQKKKKDQGKIDDLNNQIDDIPNKISDINAAISQNLIQGTFRELSTSLANALTSAFKAGEDGIDAMNKTFDDFIANAIQNSLKLALLEPVVAQFTKELTDYAQNHGNSVVGFDFEAWKKKLDAAGKNFNDGLEASKDLFKGDGTTSGSNESMRGRIEQITAPQADKLVATQTGIQLGVEKTNTLLLPVSKGWGEFIDIARSNLATAIKTEQNTFRTAENTENLKRLERVEIALNSIDRKMDNNANALQGTGRIP